MKKKRIILLLALGIPVVCILLIAGFVLSVAAMPWHDPPADYEDPESLWLLAERTEQYIMRANPDKESPARKEALKALEDIALLDISYDEKARLIHERFPEESYWTDDVREVLKRAEAGDAEAQYQLGCFYEERKILTRSGVDLERGRCVIKSRPLAAKWFRKAALQEHAAAQYLLASRIPDLTKNVSERSRKRQMQDDKERTAWYARSRANGYPEAMIFDYSDTNTKQNREAGWAILREAAEHGDVEAMIRIGNYKWSAPRESVEWFRMAAERGNIMGMLGCADACDTIAGWEEPDDAIWTETAKQWRRKAIDIAMKRLNEGSAEELYYLYPRNKTLWEELEKYTGGEEAFVKLVMPRLWKLIEHGDYEFFPTIMIALYQGLRSSGHVELDYDTIVRRLAELGFFSAQMVRAEDMLDSAAPEERAEGVRLLRKLAGFGYVSAQSQLGKCCWNGRGVPQDRAGGIRWMRKAAEQREYSAMSLLFEYLLKSGHYYESLKWFCRCSAIFHGYDSPVEYLWEFTMEKIGVSDPYQ